MSALVLWLTLALAHQAGAPPAPSTLTPGAAAVAAVVDSAKFKAAVAALDRDFDRHVTETIRLTEIPAPPFKEPQRAKAHADIFRPPRPP